MFQSKFFACAFAFNIVISGIGQASSPVSDEGITTVRADFLTNDVDDTLFAQDESLKRAKSKGHMTDESLSQVETIGGGYTYWLPELPEPPKLPDLPDPDSPTYKELAAKCKELVDKYEKSVAKYNESADNLYDFKRIQKGLVALNADAIFAKGLMVEYGVWPEEEKTFEGDPLTALDCYKAAAYKNSAWAHKRLYFIFKKGELGQDANESTATHHKTRYFMIEQSIPGTDFEPLRPDILLDLQKELQEKRLRKSKNPGCEIQ